MARSRLTTVAERSKVAARWGALSVQKNNIGVLRLVLASLVIFGHAPEMIDGNRAREPLYALTGHLTLGILAVDGFFLLSGFLIAQSMVRSSSVWTYLWRRVLRIYPAFALAYLLCVFLLGPIVGARPWEHLPETFSRLLTLTMPMSYPGELPGLPVSDLNGSMWTIAYEFRCYLLVAALGVSGLLARRSLILALTAATLLSAALVTIPAIQEPAERVFAVTGLDISATITTRLVSIFLLGVSAQLYWPEISARLSGRMAAILTAAGVVCMFVPNSAPLVVVLCGVGLLWLAMKADLGRLQTINDRWDISYGLYLYAWPIATAVLWWNRGIAPLPLALVTLVLSLAAGTVSWVAVERSTKGLGSRPG